MALIALRNIRCFDYLAYGTIFTREMFLPEKKLDVFFPARKAVDACQEVVPPLHVCAPSLKVHLKVHDACVARAGLT